MAVVTIRMDKVILPAREREREWLGCWIPANLNAALKRVANQTGRTKTDLVVMALEDFLRRIEVAPASANEE